MNQYTLKFHNKKIEQDYYAAQLKTLQKNVTLASLYYFVTAVQAMVLRFTDGKEHYPFMLALHLGVTLFFIVILIISAWKRPLFITPLCQLFSMAHTFVNVRMIMRQERIAPYIAIYTFLFMLIHMRFSNFFLPSLILVLLEHIFMISYLSGYGFEYDRFCTYMMLSLIIYLITEYQREKQRREDFLQRQIDLKNAQSWKYIMLEIQPQITALLGITNENQLSKWKLLEINKIARDEFKLDDQKKFEMFLSSVILDENDSTATLVEIDNQNQTSLKLSIDQLIRQNSKTNFYQDFTEMFTSEQRLKSNTITQFGSYHNQKFKIVISKILWENKSALLLKMESQSLEEEIKQLKELDKYKNRLLATVSHDLRTPLIGINYNFDQICYGQPIEEVEKYKRQGKANSDLLMSFIHDILDYCQMKEDKIKLNLAQFNLIELANEVIDLLSIPAGLKGVNVSLINLVVNNNEQNIYSDARRIKQIIINLISNSVKFTKKGGKVQLVVSLYKKEQFKFEVIDTGTGIKQEIIPQLAKPFATFDNENQMNKQGIGLGLNICKKLTGLMGPTDDLFISSQLGKGSKFGFQLYKNCPEIVPQKTIIIKKISRQINNNLSSCKNLKAKMICLHDSVQTFDNENMDNDLLSHENENENQNSVFSEFNVEEMSSAEYADSSQLIQNIKESSGATLFQKSMNNSRITEQQQKTMQSNEIKLFARKENVDNNSNNQIINILLADDNPFNILVLEKYLERIQTAQFHSISASNGQEAFDYFKENNKIKNPGNVQIIIMDCEMPILNGFQASRMIQNLIEKEHYVKCIIVGYTCYEGDERKCRVNGMEQFLQKPASEMAFVNFLETLLLKF